MVDVSVVIPTHNRAALVKAAIDSVLAQSRQVREIIVVDDASTDDTRNLLAGYGSRIRVLHGDGKGAAEARNRGMRAAQGKWIAFLDDDDVWVADKIERQMALAEQAPDARLIYCSDYAVDEALQVLYLRPAQPLHRGDVFDRLLIKNFIFTSCAVARRDAIEEAGYMDTALRFAHDWDLWLKIAARYPVDFHPEPLVLYRQSASGCLTRDMRVSSRLEEMRTVLSRALQLRPPSPKVQRAALFELERQSASTWLGQGNRAHAFQHTVRAIRHRPAQFEGYRLLAYCLTPEAVRHWGKRALAGRGNRPAAPRD